MASSLETIETVELIDIFFIFTVLCVVVASTNSEQIIKEAYFNGTSYIRLKTPMTIWGHSGISFRSCRGKKKTTA